MSRPWILAETNWEVVRQTEYRVAVLPWGATEAHNRHLPYATDTIQSEAVAAMAAERAWNAGARVLVLPAVPFGVQTGQREVPFCLNMNPSTQRAVIRDLVESLIDHGVDKLVILNGHGGNDFRQIIRELQGEVPILVAQVNWYQVADAREHFAEPGDHAGELETSVTMHLRPELVRPLSEAGPGAARQFTVRGFREGWAWTPRHWVSVTDDTGVGDPRQATAAKGAAFLEAVVEKIATFLVELAAVGDDGLYE
ncbi:MAG TPA: creatininase family protein [Gemmatimonadales bacterium]|nr:creatininase family protein [Gemmatimonadales bacterium]